MQRLGQYLHSIGLGECIPEIDPLLLRVTLVHACNFHQRPNFYFEVWSEPSEGYPKNSRTHQGSLGLLDLGCERLELDWTGGEREVVLHAVEYSGPNQSRDLPIGEVRIPRQAVERYAAEARSAEDDLRSGTRELALSAVDRPAALRRRQRFQDMLLPSRWFAALVSKVGAEQGLHIPDPDEVAKLERENRELRTENTTLRGWVGHGSSSSSSSGATAAGPQETTMTVAARFEILPRPRAAEVAPVSVLRNASFQGDQSPRGR